MKDLDDAEINAIKKDLDEVEELPLPLLTAKVNSNESIMMEEEVKVHPA